MAVVERQTPQPNLLVPAMVLVLVILAFAVGALWQRVEFLQKGTSTNVAANPQAPAAPAQPPADPTVSVPADTLNLDPLNNNDHVQGNKSAPITIIEYSDLQCPFCEKFHPTMKQAMKEYEGKLKWVYRHFPLESIHPVALKAAIASECVFNLGGNEKFWSFIDKNFTSGTTGISEDRLTSQAVEVGVNKASFQSCLSGNNTQQKVKDQQTSGSKAGVQGTPNSFVLDGKGNAWVIGGAVPYETLKQIIDKALQS